MKATKRWPQQLQWGGNWPEAYKVNSTAKENGSCRDDGRRLETWLRGDLVGSWIRGLESMKRTKAQESRAPWEHTRNLFPSAVDCETQRVWRARVLDNTSVEGWSFPISRLGRHQLERTPSFSCIWHQQATRSRQPGDNDQRETIPRDAVGRWWVVGVIPWKAVFVEMTQCGHNKFWLSQQQHQHRAWPRQVCEDRDSLASQHKIPTVEHLEDCLPQSKMLSPRRTDSPIRDEKKALTTCSLLNTAFCRPAFCWVGRVSPFTGTPEPTKVNLSIFSPDPKNNKRPERRATANDWPPGQGQPQHKQQWHACHIHSHKHTHTHALNKP